MASPLAYDADRHGLRGSPELRGDMAGARGVPTAALRHRKPSASKLRQIHLYLIVAACHDAHLSSEIVAESLGITARHVRRLYARKAKAKGRPAR